jgi:hypothetical protein
VRVAWSRYLTVRPSRVFRAVLDGGRAATVANFPSRNSSRHGCRGGGGDQWPVILADSGISRVTREAARAQRVAIRSFGVGVKAERRRKVEEEGE